MERVGKQGTSKGEVEKNGQKGKRGEERERGKEIRREKHDLSGEETCK